MIELFVIFFLFGWLAREYITRVLDIDINLKKFSKISRLRKDDEQDEEVVFDDDE